MRHIERTNRALVTVIAAAAATVAAQLLRQIQPIHAIWTKLERKRKKNQMKCGLESVFRNQFKSVTYLSWC